jgi:hypothetical protein
MKRILIKPYDLGYEIYYQDDDGTRLIGKAMSGVLETIKIFFKLEGLEVKEI